MAGNANSGRRAEKPFRDALRMEISEAGSRPKALREIAVKLVDLALSGDMQAIKEFNDRTDGKVPQGLVGGDEDDNPINLVHRIERIIVNSPDTDGGGLPPTA